MSDPRDKHQHKDIVAKLREVIGFGWQCGMPLRDKGSYMRCGCGCSHPRELDNMVMDIHRPAILDEAADEIERLRAERDQARRKWCIQSIQAQTGNRAPVEVLAKKLAEDIFGWDCFKENTNG